MNSKERSNFRQTKVWRGFRSICKQLCQGVDRLTGSKLSKTFNLHHMDQRHENYGNLDPERFICLNKESHDCVHFVYRYWIKDKDFLKRLEQILIQMEEQSND